MSASKIFIYVFVIFFLFTAVVILAVMPFVLKPLLQTQVVVTATVTPTEFGAHPRVLSRVTVTPTAPVTVAPTATPTATSAPVTRRPIPTPRVEDGTPFILCWGKVVTDRLNLRTGPGIEFQVIQDLGRAVAFAAFAKNLDGSWIKIILADRTTGWVNGSYVSLVGCTIDDLPDPAP